MVTALVAIIVFVAAVVTAFVAGRQSAEPTDEDRPGAVPVTTIAERATERFRPRLHFTPDEHWMNDPNGPVFLDGRYHLFYQYNPGGNLWGEIAWGHAVSDDLVEWEELGVAISAQPPDMIFSGSAVHDAAGFGGRCTTERCLVAVYTYHSIEPGSGLVEQTQHVAYSSDDGRTFTAYEGNPVVDFDLADFRDPNVFWHGPTERWVMTVALPVERSIMILTSPDLVAWEVASRFGPAGATEGIWECPVLLELPIEGTDETAWVLKVDHGAGHVSGGSGGQYFVGDFDGRTFVPREPDGPIRWVDWGSDFYCAMQFSGLPDPVREATWIAWMSNWDYASATPTHPWRGAMTLPRSIRLDGGSPAMLIQEPPASLAERRRDERRFEGSSVAEIAEAVGADRGGSVLDIELAIELGGARSVELELAADDTSAVTLRYDADAATLTLDRSRVAATIGSGFADGDAAPLPLRDGRIDLRIVLDRSSVEVFADGGRVALTNLVFPTEGAEQVRIRSHGEPTGPVTLSLWDLA
jgi:fructan beta-fructosidase